MNNSNELRQEQDSLGTINVPLDALYGAQTQRAVDNFDISGIPMPASFINALGLIKSSAAQANLKLNLMEKDISNAIVKAANEVAAGNYDDHFPVDVYQTGSGTSSNMNANEVIAKLASEDAGILVHPNDHVNMGQSSNDVIPTAIHLSCVLQVEKKLLPALSHLHSQISKRVDELQNTSKTGRTHLMDAMPVTMAQEMSAWGQQIEYGIERLTACLPRLRELAIGGTAVGSGINAHPEFGKTVCDVLSEITTSNFVPKKNYFEALSTQDAAVELSGVLKTIAVSVMKIANDLRWMNSGPLAGFAEIVLPAVQPGSSIMPGKVNPVICESMCMIAAQVMGNDVTIGISGQAGNFQLNVMLPVIAYNVLQSIMLLANGANMLADKAIAGFKVNNEVLEKSLAKNPILVTALNHAIGYELGAKVAKAAYQQQRAVIDVAQEMTDLSRDELQRLLDPFELTKGGIKS